ncbi:MAG: sporulation protein YqfD, partial [Eubacteriales bacterium]|nr:sporulation protein YqfD [Eubacteriales bacterium]
SLVLLKLMSLYVWNISFTGNMEYSDQLLAKFLKGQSYRMGMRIEDIDCDGIESRLRNQFDNITWVSAEIRGTRLIIHIKENDGVSVTAADEKRERSSIYSDYEGTVVSIITRKGTPLVKVGDTVSAGDELVSGKVEFKNDAGEIVSEEAVYADAKVVIRTRIMYSDAVKRVQEQKIYTGRTKCYRIVGVSDKYVKLGLGKVKYSEYDCVTENDNMKLSNDFCLPIWHGKSTYYEYNIQSVEMSDSELEMQLKERLITYLHKLEENNVQICSNRVNINLNSSSGIMEGIIEADVTEGSNNRQ